MMVAIYRLMRVRWGIMLDDIYENIHNNIKVEQLYYEQLFNMQYISCTLGRLVPGVTQIRFPKLKEMGVIPVE